MVNVVPCEAKPEPGDVFLAKIGRRLLNLSPPLRVGPGDALPCGTGLPDAQEPEPVEAHPGKAIQFGVRNVVQRGPAAESVRQLREPDARVDLIERGIERRLHVSSQPVLYFTSDVPRAN